MKLEMRNVQGLQYTLKGKAAEAFRLRLQQDTRVRWNNTTHAGYYNIISPFIYNIGDIDLHLSYGDKIKLILYLYTIVYMNTIF